MGDGPLAGAKLDARISGTLAALAVDARGTRSDVKLTARTTVTPFERVAFERASVTLADVDIAAFVDTLPHTRLALGVDVGPATEGFAGTFRAANAAAGPLDDKRIPLSIAHWHEHVNWCLPPKGQTSRWLEQHDGAPVFGPKSAIATKDACDAVGGDFRPRVFGWMIHANVFADDPAEVWGDHHHGGH